MHKTTTVDCGENRACCRVRRLSFVQFITSINVYILVQLAPTGASQPASCRPGNVWTVRQPLPVVTFNQSRSVCLEACLATLEHNNRKCGWQLIVVWGPVSASRLDSRLLPKVPTQAKLAFRSCCLRTTDFTPSPLYTVHCLLSFYIITVTAVV